MIQSTISFYVMEFYKQFAAYTTQQLQEFGLRHILRNCIIRWKKRE